MILCLPVIFRHHFWLKNNKRQTQCERRRPVNQYFKVLYLSKRSIPAVIILNLSANNLFTIAAMMTWFFLKKSGSTEFILTETLKPSSLKKKTVVASLLLFTQSLLHKKILLDLLKISEFKILWSNHHKKFSHAPTRSEAARVKTTHLPDALLKLRTWINKVWILWKPRISLRQREFLLKNFKLLT